jgi:serine/threonine protein kinase
VTPELLDRLPEALRDRFEPLALLGAGAMGAVFRCRDRELQREVALKVVTYAVDATAQERFRREARCLAEIQHPSVVRVYDFATTPQGPYLVMECLEGIPLDKAELEHPLDALLDAAEGIAECHRHGILHRDLKPANMFRTEDGRTVILDFGLVKPLDATQLTAPRTAMGSPVFMAPEILRGEEASPASDWFAWGVSLYRILEGRYPYTFEQVKMVVAGAPWPAMVLRSVAPASPEGRAIQACMAEHPEDRPAGLAQLRKLLAGPEGEYVPAAARSLPLPVSAPERPPASDGSGRVIAPLVGVAGLLVLGLGLAMRPEAPPPPLPSPPASPAAPLHRTEFPPGYGARAAAELRALASLPDAPDLRDPLVWGEVLERLPETRRFRRWIAAGNLPEDLPRELREDLKVADQAFARHGAPRPFFPYVYSAPDAPGGPVPVRVLRHLEKNGLPPPPHAGGTWGMASAATSAW